MSMHLCVDYIVNIQCCQIASKATGRAQTLSVPQVQYKQTVRHETGSQTQMQRNVMSQEFVSIPHSHGSRLLGTFKRERERDSQSMDDCISIIAATSIRESLDPRNISSIYIYMVYTH